MEGAVSELSALRLALNELLLDLLLLLPRLLVAAVVLLLARWLGGRAARLAYLALRKRTFSAIHRRFFANLAFWGVMLVGFSLALNLLGLQILAAGLLASSSATAIILGFAFREIGENFLAGFFLAFSRPFGMGDLIECAGFQGVVRGIDLRTTHIRTGDGRDIYIPNAKIFNQPLVNFTRDGLRRHAFEVGIDYADDAARARDLLTEVAQGVEGVLTEPGPGTTISELAADTVRLTVFFWEDTFVPTKLPGGIRSEVMNRCRERLLAAGFTVSANVTTALSLEAPEGVRVTLTD